MISVSTGCSCQSNTDDDACTYLGKTYELGDAWVDDVSCDVCQCNQYGVQCNAGMESDICVFNSTYICNLTWYKGLQFRTQVSFGQQLY